MLRAASKIATGSLALLAALSLTARAGATGLLEYSPLETLEGEPSCPSTGQVLEQFRQCLCEADLETDGRISLRISVSRMDGDLVATSVVARAGDRSREHNSRDAGSCSAVVTAEVLHACALARVIAPCSEPEGRSPSTEERSPDTAPVEKEAVHPPQADRPREKSTFAPTQPESAAASPRTATTVELSVGKQWTYTEKDVGWQGGFTTQLAVHSRRLSIGLAAEVQLPTDPEAAAKAKFETGSLLLMPCWRGAVLSACASVAAGVVRDPQRTYLIESRDLLLATNGRVAADLPIYRALSLRLHGDGGLVWTSKLSEVSGTQSQSGPLGTAGVGIAMVLTFDDQLRVPSIK